MASSDEKKKRLSDIAWDAGADVVECTAAGALAREIVKGATGNDNAGDAAGLIAGLGLQILKEVVRQDDPGAGNLIIPRSDPEGKRDFRGLPRRT